VFGRCQKPEEEEKNFGEMTEHEQNLINNILLHFI
jgi:hypothetical protein